jgi:capsid portal protein
MDYTTGKYGKTAKDKLATEIIHWRIYTPGSPYGIPRYQGNIVAIYGDRAADEVNFFTLSNNNVPNIILSVSNGRMTSGSIKRIKEFVKSSGTGARNYSRIMILESESEDSKGAKIGIEPLVNSQIQDQLWIEYGKTNSERVRISFRMPPIFIGKADDYTRATAETSRKIGDEQIFSPERRDFDDDMERLIFPDLEVKYHRFVSNSPNVTDDKDLIQVLVAAEKTGAMTPRLAHIIVSDILNRELPPIDEEKLDPDIPMTIQVLEHAKNVGDEMQAMNKAMWGDDLLDRIENLRDRLDVELSKR